MARRIDCPDWAYAGETRYQTQVQVLKDLNNVLDINKVCVCGGGVVCGEKLPKSQSLHPHALQVAIGFETLGVDVQTQYQAFVDPALPWTAITPAQKAAGMYYVNCTQVCVFLGQQPLSTPCCLFSSSPCVVTAPSTPART